MLDIRTSYIAFPVRSYRAGCLAAGTTTRARVHNEQSRRLFRRGADQAWMQRLYSTPPYATLPHATLLYVTLPYITVPYQPYPTVPDLPYRTYPTLLYFTLPTTPRFYSGAIRVHTHTIHKRYSYLRGTLV